MASDEAAGLRQAIEDANARLQAQELELRRREQEVRSLRAAESALRAAHADLVARLNAIRDLTTR